MTPDPSGLRYESLSADAEDGSPECVRSGCQAGRGGSPADRPPCRLARRRRRAIAPWRFAGQAAAPRPAGVLILCCEHESLPSLAGGPPWGPALPPFYGPRPADRLSSGYSLLTATTA